MTRLHVLSGPEMGQSFDLKEDVTYIGRSLGNDIQLNDNTVSRKHLKIIHRGNKYFIDDLESQNGTMYNGTFVGSHVELPIKEGVPITIGMSVMCLGEEGIMPFLDSVGVNMEIAGESGIFEIHKEKTNQKKLELLYKVSSLLDENLPVNITLEKILGYVFDLLKKVDTGAFILVDPESKKISDVVSMTAKPDGDSATVYCTDVVRQVIENKKTISVSNVETEEKADFIDTLKILKIQSVLCAPLISDSQIVGVIYVDSLKGPFAFSKEDVLLFVDLCQRTALFLLHARMAFESTTIADAFIPGAPPPL